MKVGFTGTRRKTKITDYQRQRLRWLMETIYCDMFSRSIDSDEKCELHHGDCTGADAMAGEIAWMHRGWREIVHPPDTNKWRAFRKGDECRMHKPHKARDRDIVDETEILIAVPDGTQEKFRGSGTWYTIRYARKKGREIWIIYPSGVQFEGAK